MAKKSTRDEAMERFKEGWRAALEEGKLEYDKDKSKRRKKDEAAGKKNGSKK